MDFFNQDYFAAYYEKAEAELEIQKVPENTWNDNVHIFKDGFEKNGYKWATLDRAQKDCRYENGNDCIECLSGCPLDSKQSMPVTVLKKAIEAGTELLPETEILEIKHFDSYVEASAVDKMGNTYKFHSKKVVMAAGAIGNSLILQRSGLQKSLSKLGDHFFVHPQEMVIGVYDRNIDSFKGGFQALKSADEGFRRDGFKLENVFAPPASIAMLIPGFGDAHLSSMKKLRKFGFIEAAVRDTNPGKIKLKRNGRVSIDKTFNNEDYRRRDAGMKAINNIFNSTGATEIIPGQVSVGLHLIGGCIMGKTAKDSVVGEDFKVHGHKNLYISDSSSFPNAPGQNPSLSIMAMTLMASERICNDF